MTDCRPRVALRDDRRPYGCSCMEFRVKRCVYFAIVDYIALCLLITSLVELNTSGVRVHSPRGGAAAEPKITRRRSYMEFDQLLDMYNMCRTKYTIFSQVYYTYTEKKKPYNSIKSKKIAPTTATSNVIGRPPVSFARATAISERPIVQCLYK